MEKTPHTANDRNQEVAMTETKITLCEEEVEGTIAEMIEIREQEAEDGDDYSIYDVLLDYFPEQVDFVLLKSGVEVAFDDYLADKCREYGVEID